MKAVLSTYAITPTILDLFLDKLEHPCLLISKDGLIQKMNLQAIKRFGSLENPKSKTSVFEYFPSIRKSYWKKILQSENLAEHWKRKVTYLNKNNIQLPCTLWIYPLQWGEQQRLLVLMQENLASSNYLPIELEPTKKKIEVVEQIHLNSSIKSFDSKGILTQNPNYLQLLKQIKTIAPSDLPVLITGEIGTEKKVLAEILHVNSKRNNEKFFSINCGRFEKTEELTLHIIDLNKKVEKLELQSKLMKK